MFYVWFVYCLKYYCEELVCVTSTIHVQKVYQLLLFLIQTSELERTEMDLQRERNYTAQLLEAVRHDTVF